MPPSPSARCSLFSRCLACSFWAAGGIYGRIFTPTEASGIGAVGAAIIASGRGHLLNLSEWIDQAQKRPEGRRASLFMVLFGALVFPQYITLTGMPSATCCCSGRRHEPLTLPVGADGDRLCSGHGHSVRGHGGILLLLVLGKLPALEASGVDLIRFGILVVLVIEMGPWNAADRNERAVVKSISQDIEISKIFRCCLFILAMFFVLTALLVVPDIVLFLIE